MKVFKIIGLLILACHIAFAQPPTDSTKKHPVTPTDTTNKTNVRKDSIKAGSFNPVPSPDMVNQVRIQMLSDSLAGLYQRFLNIESTSKTYQQKLQQVNQKVKKGQEGLVQINQQNKKSSKTLRDSLKSIFNQHNTLRQEVNVGVKAIKDLKIQDLLDAKNRYNTNITNIKTTASFIYAFNNGLNGLEASLAYAEYANSINELNNPQNNELGFSLESDIVNMIKNQVTGKLRRFKRSKSARFFRIVSNIIRNPITQSLVSSVPAVNSINSVNNLVHNLVVDHKGVSPQQLLSFQQGLRKYVEHYDNLSALNKVLAVGNENLKVKTEALRKLTNEFVKEMVVTLYDDQSLESLKNKTLNNIINDYYTYSRVLQQIEKIEKKYQVGGNLNYGRIIRDKRIGYSLLALNKIEFITGEIEQISSEYLTTLEEYHKNIVLVLMNAYKLSKNTSKIQQKIKLLNQQFEKVKINYKKQVDIKTILSRLHEIPRY